MDLKLEFLVWIPPFIPITLNEKYKLFRGIQGPSLHQLLRISLSFIKSCRTLGCHLSHRASVERSEFRGEHKMKSNIFIILL